MNFHEYEKDGKQLYEDFAELIKKQLTEAVAKDTKCPRVQAYQSRAKAAASLKRKLENRGALYAPDIERTIKDLAGARVIFYTNPDVDTFLHRRIIPEILKVHWDEVKAHHPTDENERLKYEAFHYVVSLPDELADRDEYARFRGLRCEIQIHTLLSHAWAESSHDIIYKGADTPGFGSKAVDALRARLNKTMDEYLKPAGYELDKVQADYGRLMQGKDLFDRGELEALTRCDNNNERFDRLKAIAENLIPNFDDIGSVYGEIRRTLLTVAAAARATETKPIVIEGVEFQGIPGKRVVEQAVQILLDLRYSDVEGTFQTLIELYKHETDRDIRNQIIGAVHKLASYNLHVWRQAGPYVQMVLAETLAKLSKEEILEIRSIGITVWSECLRSELDGTTWAADSVTISKGPIPSNENIKAVRAQAVDGLFMILDSSEDEADQHTVITSFWRASQLPYQADYSNGLLGTALADMKAIAERLLLRLGNMKFDLWEHIESHMFHEFKRFRPIAEAEDDNNGCKALAQALIDKIVALRQKMNRNRDFVRYKTLVGFESVFPQQWDDNTFDYAKVEAYRKARAAKYVESIHPQNAKEWLKLISRCAATKSSDWATFLIFGEFLRTLGQQKPQVALQLLAADDANILNFLHPILAGLAASDAKAEYAATVERHVNGKQQLIAVARHYRIVENATVASVAKVLEAATKAEDTIAVIECLVLAVSKRAKLGNDVIGTLFLPALDYLTGKKDCRWVHGAWFLPETREFFEQLRPEQLGKVLDNLINAKKIDREYERVVAVIGRIRPALVWRFFGERLSKDDNDEADYEAIPYQMFVLDKILNADPNAAVIELRSWYRAGDNMFQFTGGRLLHAVFPSFTEGLAGAFIKLVEGGDNDDIEFALHTLHNYRGEATLHPVAKAIVARLAGDDSRLSRVEILLENTGVVSGEFGMVEALRERKAMMTGWLEDRNALVKGFAERAIRHLDNRIAMEQRSAEMQKEQRRRDYE
jgi:ppGpp synthetase/RelA/SpoT-type nucleotidyltranferase